MMMIAGLLLFLDTLPAAVGQSRAPAPPPALSSYFTNGVVAPGDFRWLRGRFDGASPDEVKTFAAAANFDTACYEWSRRAMVAELKALGQAFDPCQGVYTRPLECRQFAQPYLPDGTSWEAFSAALARVRPYALGVLRATELAEQQVVNRGSYAEQLRTRPLGEQTLRYAWIDSQRHQAETAGYSTLERDIYEAILTRSLDDRYQANTAWLAAWIAQKGWPTRHQVGEDASSVAWLLVQHADANPAFQLTALRLMTPLAASGAIERRDFAMLTDRVQLKLKATQRYGTQWTCEKGRRLPLALESDEATTNELRAGVGLDSLSDNAERMEEMYGDCPPQN